MTQKRHMLTGVTNRCVVHKGHSPNTMDYNAFANSSNIICSKVQLIFN